MIRNRPTDRRGFSLIELLAVMAILAVLTAITVGVLVSVRGSSTSKVTDETLSKIQTALDQERDKVANACRTERTKKSPNFTALVAYCGGDEDRAEGLLVYMKMRAEFPETVAEATTNVVIGTAVVQPRRTFASVAGLTGAAHEVAAVLLFLNLSEKSGDGSGTQADTISQGDIAVGGRTVRVFRDAWGTHIAFVRHAQNQELLNTPQYGSKDPCDPKGKLFNGSLGTDWPNSATGNRVAAEKILFQGTSQFNGRIKMLTAVSAGPNKAFDTVANSLASDDVFSYRVKKQGQKAD